MTRRGTIHVVAMDPAAARESLSKLKSSPYDRVLAAWYATLGFSAIIVICGLVAAGMNDADPQGNKGAGFAAVWTIFILVALGVGGTFVLHRARTPMSVGLLLGNSIMTSQLCFTLFAVFLGLANNTESSGNDDDATAHAEGSDRALAAFFFLQSVTYLAFFVLLLTSRDTVIVDPSKQANAMEAAGDSAVV